MLRIFVVLACWSVILMKAHTVPADRDYTGQGHCEYRGRNYSQGEKWSEGCEVNCSCEDAFTGFFVCSKRPECTETRSTAPPGCHLEADPNDDCCQVAVCNNFIGR